MKMNYNPKIRPIFLDTNSAELVIKRNDESNYTIKKYVQAELTDNITLLHNMNTDKIIVEVFATPAIPYDTIKFPNLNTIAIEFSEPVVAVVNLIFFN